MSIIIHPSLFVVSPSCADIFLNWYPRSAETLRSTMGPISHQFAALVIAATQAELFIPRQLWWPYGVWRLWSLISGERNYLVPSGIAKFGSERAAGKDFGKQWFSVQPIEYNGTCASPTYYRPSNPFRDGWEQAIELLGIIAYLEVQNERLVYLFLSLACRAKFCRKSMPFSESDSELKMSPMGGLWGGLQDRFGGWICEGFSSTPLWFSKGTSFSDACGSNRGQQASPPPSNFKPMFNIIKMQVLGF